MWLFTTHGFFSLTESPVAPGMLQFRARSRADLEALRDALGCGAEIIETPPPADYRWRIVVSREEALAIVTAEVEAIDYANFKGAVHDTPGQEDKSGPYMRVWSAMLGVQNAAEHQDAGEPDLFRPDAFTGADAEGEEALRFLEQDDAPRKFTSAEDLHRPKGGALDPLDNPKRPACKAKRKGRRKLEQATGGARK